MKPRHGRKPIEKIKGIPSVRLVTPDGYRALDYSKFHLTQKQGLDT